MLHQQQQQQKRNSSAGESIRSQSIDLKIPLNIPGVTSSDSYLRMTQIDNENKKLKKKMKKKAKEEAGKKGKKKGKNSEEEEEDESEGPVIKILSNEMPEGAVDDSDDEKKYKDANDPHRALDINLDESVPFLYHPFLQKHKN